MKLFNIGALEFLFIILLAFIVLGPEKAIKAAGDVARWIRKVTKSQFWQDLLSTSKEIKSFPQKLMDDAELQDTISGLDRSTSKIKQVLSDTRVEIDQKIGEIKDEKHEENKNITGDEIKV